MKKVLVILVQLILIAGLMAIPVSREEAVNIALIWQRSAIGTSAGIQSIVEKPNSAQPNLIDWYEISFVNGGYIFVSAEDKAAPILGYSTVDQLNSANLPENLAWFLDQYHNEFTALRAETGIETNPEWQALRSGDYAAILPSRPVSPLLTTNWNQDWPYNSMCPTDNAGPGNHVYVGCMALSMGQIMKYWSYPTTGTGSHTYTHATYGAQTANFGATTYNWSAMPNTLYNTPNASISTLLYHCAVAVDMDFAPDGSGAQASPARNAFINYFNYETTAMLAWKQSYTEPNWLTLITTDLNASRPVLYVGYDATYGGHAWVCDGYQGTNYLHMNWGWDGQYNGYFYVTNLNPNPYHFNNQQGAIVRIQPPAAVEPPTNLTAVLSDETNILLNWVSPVTRSLTGFTIYRDGQLLIQTDATTTNYFDINLSPGSYQYWVVANFTTGDSAPSNTAVATVYPAAVVNFQDSFEAYQDFGSAFSPWFTYDNDLSATTALDDVTFPNEGNPLAFMVFNPSASTPPITDFTAFDGNKVVACFSALNPPNNDWLVTPKWNTGSVARLRFWAKTAYPENGLEQMKVGYSLTDPNPANMTIISGAQPISVPAAWTEYNYTLSANTFTNLFAGIQCVTNDGFLLLIDKMQLWSSYTDNDDSAQNPATELALQAYPNPFHTVSTLVWQQKSAGNVSLRVYDLKGRLVKTLSDGYHTSGKQQTFWNGLDNQDKPAASGIYQVRITDASGASHTQKIIYVK